MRLIIFASRAAVTVRSLGLCRCVSCYVYVCRLLLMVLSLSLSTGFYCRWKDQRWLGPERQFAKEVGPPGSRQPKSSWENNHS